MRFTTVRSASRSAALRRLCLVRLVDVVIEAVEQIDPPGDAGLTEKLSLRARQFQFTYIPQDSRGGQGTPVSFGWDCASDTRF
jgi:hypothetical protein